MTPVIDAHHHLWDQAPRDQPWTSEALAAIGGRFGPEDLAPHLAATGVERTVLIQTRSSLEETRDFLATAAATTFIGGVVGWVDLCDPAVGDTIAALRAGPGGDHLVAIRHQVHDEPDPDWLLRSDVRAGLAAVGAADLPYDLLIRPREVPAAVRTVRELPDIRFVVDHLAKPPIATAERQPWWDLLAAIAAEPNTWCKVSGLPTEADWDTWTIDDLRPYVDHAIDVFGPDRLLFGSDWPVCLLAAPYEVVVETARTLMAGLSETERADVFGGTAARVYRLG